MDELKRMYDEFVRFCRAHRAEIRRWLWLSLGLTLALNLVVWLLPVIPILLLLALPLAGWSLWDRGDEGDGDEGQGQAGP